jgi:hypothetical protein
MFDSGKAPGRRRAPIWCNDEIRSAALVAHLRALLVTEGGFTLDCHTARPVLVGLAVCADPTRTLRLRMDDWNDRVVLEWLSNAAAHLRSARHEALCLGGWHPPGSDLVHLDVVRVVPPEGRHLAEMLGRHHRQHAMFDLARRALVPLAT